MKKLLLIMSLIGTLYADSVMNEVKACLEQKEQTPERTCINIAIKASEKQPTTTLKADIFYLCATACENPSLYYNELEKD